MAVDSALGLTGCAAGEHQHHRRFGRHVCGRRSVGLPFAQRIPPVIDFRVPAHRFARVAQNDNVPQSRHQGHGVVDHVLERHVLAATPGSVCGQHGDCAAVVKSRGDRLGAESGIERQDNATDLDDGEHRRDGLGNHRQIDPDDIAGLASQLPKTLGQAACVLAQTLIGPALDRSAFGFPDDGFLVSRGTLKMSVEAVQRGVGGTAHTPFGPGDAARSVHDLRVGLEKLHPGFTDDQIPEPFGVGIGFLQQRSIPRWIGRRNARRSQKSRNIALGNDLRIGMPDNRIVPGNDSFGHDQSSLPSKMGLLVALRRQRAMGLSPARLFVQIRS